MSTYSLETRTDRRRQVHCTCRPLGLSYLVSGAFLMGKQAMRRRRLADATTQVSSSKPALLPGLQGNWTGFVAGFAAPVGDSGIDGHGLRLLYKPALHELFLATTFLEHLHSFGRTAIRGTVAACMSVLYALYASQP
jgi:hypothetical protein